MKFFSKEAAPHANRLYQGWYVVLGAFLILAITFGVRYSFGVFVRPMFIDYGWSMSAISACSSLNILIYAIFSIFSGRMVDKFAPMWMMIIGFCLISMGLFYLTYTRTVWGLYLSYGVLCGIGSAATGLVSCSATVGKWFHEHRGVALGLSTMGIGIGTMALSPVAGYIVSHYDWRVGFIFFSVLVLVLGITFSFLFMGKTVPESRGSLHNGEPNAMDKPGTNFQRDIPQKASIKSLLGNLRFGLIAICFGLAGMTVNMTFFHQVAYAVEKNINQIEAAAALGMVGLASALGKFFFGWLSDKIKESKKSAALGFFVMAVGMVILLNAKSAKMIWLYAVLYGFGYGSMSPLMPSLISDYFGRNILGSAYGVLTFLMGGICGGIGPILGGLIYDWQGSYTIAWIFNTTALFFASVLIYRLPPPKQAKTG